MADEMDEPLDAEENGSTPEETMREGVKASSAGGAENKIAGGEAGSQQAHAEQRLEASDAADDGGQVMGSTTGLDSRDLAGEKPPSTAASSTDPTETLYDTAPNVDQHESRRTQAASAGTPTRSGGAPRVDGGELDKPGLDLLYDVELDATLQFGSKEMLLRDVLELGPGDVVELDRHIAQPVDLVVGDRIVARGEVVVASGNFALRVTEVATPQMRLESIRCLF
jgi:flagellar motor switch protein FliN/FliY